MKIQISPNSVTLEEIKEKLTTRFPDYEYSYRSKKQLVAKKNGTIGAIIMLRKKSLHINGTFPTIGGQMIFTLVLILIGVLIPIIVYLAAFQPKMKALENELGNFLRSEIQGTDDTI